MALFTKEQFEKLAQTEEKYCISIYIPTYREGENKESVIRLKNQVSVVEKQLEEMGLKPGERDEYLRPIRDELLDNSSVWRHLSDALIVFRSKNKFEYHFLPLDVEEFSHVSNRFYLLPLVSIFNQDNLFFVLLLSLNKNRLYEATQHEITEINIQDLFPDTMLDSAGHDVVQKSLEVRSRIPGQDYAPFHGKGEGKDYKSKEILKYLEDVDRSLNELLEGYEVPLVVASVDELFSHFKKTSNYKNLYPDHVQGNYDDGDILLAHEKALDVLRPYFDRVKTDKKQQYSEAIGKTTSSMEDIVISADAGRIDTLFVAKGKHVWGEYQQKSGKIIKHSDKTQTDTDLLDFAARNVLLKNGKVFIEDQEELPEKDAPANAILRY